MMVKVEGNVQGYVERKGKENRVYRSVDVYVKGKDPGNLRLNIPWFPPRARQRSGKW